MQNASSSCRYAHERPFHRQRKCINLRINLCIIFLAFCVSGTRRHDPLAQVPGVVFAPAAGHHAGPHRYVQGKAQRPRPLRSIVHGDYRVTTICEKCIISAGISHLCEKLAVGGESGFHRSGEKLGNFDTSHCQQIVRELPLW